MLRYKLDNLGWYQFESLCQSLLKARFSLAVESWGGHSDLGREAYYDGPLRINVEGEPTPGPFVFQAKFVSEANAAGARPTGALVKAVESECKMLMTRYGSRGVADIKSYVLMTNVKLTATMRKKTCEILSKALGGCKLFQIGGSDLCDWLDNTPNIRVAFPQLLGLSDLSHLVKNAIHAPVVARSTLERARAVELAQVFAPTGSYSKALSVLDQHHFVVLTGPPEMGKTVIARMIGLAKLGEGWECFECRKPDDLFAMYDDSKPQVFIADDAFGSTEYRPDLARPWADELDRIMRILDKQHWLLWTTRPAPLHFALENAELKDQAAGFPRSGEVTVDAGRLTHEEKALILYRHAKSAGLEDVAKRLVKRYAEIIIRNPHFTPERIRRLIAEILKSQPDRLANKLDGEDTLTVINSLLETPTDAMKKSFSRLPSQHKAALLSLLDQAPGKVDIQKTIKSYNRLEPSVSEDKYISIIDDLAGHFLRTS